VESFAPAFIFKPFDCMYFKGGVIDG
jgi:hypothetical protein